MITSKSLISPQTTLAIQTALERVPPLWPLQSFVAVNPFLGFTSMPFDQACAKLSQSNGELPLLTNSEYFDAFESGQITYEHLAQVEDGDWTAEQLIAFVNDPDADTNSTAIPTMADLLDMSRPRAHWSVFIVDEVSKWCAVHFDKNQTTWNSPWRDQDLYSAWREAALSDRNPEAFGLESFRSFVSTLPEDAEETISWCLEHLPMPGDVEVTDFLYRQLMTISGWAGHAQYLTREDRMAGRDTPVLRDLLAIRLAYDTALYSAFNARETLLDAAERWTPGGREDAVAALSRWQLAYESGYQETLSERLTAAQPPATSSRPTFQAIFCIDVRSGIFRRHLEAVAGGSQTIGFAGFFGFPVAYRNVASEETSARCPVLLTPNSTTVAGLPEGESRDRQVRRNVAGAWKAIQNSSASCFSFVEAAGVFFGPRLGLKGSSTCGCAHEASPVFENEDPDMLELRVNMALGALKGMGLKQCARLVLICGHGSQSANNPYASSLDCGACGGHAGDVNARLAATTLNHPVIRQALASRGVELPDDTIFIAGLHNTMTDEVTLFHDDQLPQSHEEDLAGLQRALVQAGHLSRAERAPFLGLDSLPEAKIPDYMGNRTADISQVRPEWGLANNAALIAAPRWRTAGLSLESRVFLHDYEAGHDADGAVLTLILTAPVVVASWINLQYYASRVNPRTYGSGNKTLHHVTAGLGVMEGNSGDLRTGLPLQSIHDGTRFMHEARRLSVFIEAPGERIDAVLAANPEVCDLFRNKWLHLFAIQGGTTFRWSPSGWAPI